jgi:hypothetical protein
MNMNCAEFQKVLPYIIESGGNAEEERHLRACPVCSDLVQDLRYIAEQAKLLVPMEEPSPQVWNGIQESLEREGLVKKPARARGRLLGPQGILPWVAGLAAIVLVVCGVILYRRGAGQQAPTVTVANQNSAEQDPQDQQVLAHVERTRPEMKDTYAQTLKQVNASIREAKQVVATNPTDRDARTALERAYEQKAMVYDLATSSLQ